MTGIEFADGRRIGVESSAPDFVFSAVLPPRHAGPPAHRHRRETEVFTVGAGQLLVRVGRERRLLQPGESVSVPPGTTHAFGDPFDEPARFRTVETPAGPLQAQLRALAAATGRPPLLELARINAEHDLSFSVAGLPDRPQRVVWWLLARVARLASGTNDSFVRIEATNESLVPNRAGPRDQSVSRRRRVRAARAARSASAG